MDPLEEEFCDLRNWQQEVLQICQAFQVASGYVADHITVHPATLALMRQLAAQNQAEESWIPMFGNPNDPDDHSVLVSSSLVLRLELSLDLALSTYQVGGRIRVTT